MIDLSQLEIQARLFRRVSFSRIPDDPVFINFLVSIPLVGSDFELGSKTISARIFAGESFLGIPFASLESANLGGLRFDDQGNAEIMAWGEVVPPLAP